MDLIQQTLSACGLFSSLTANEIEALACQARLTLRRYARDEVVAFEEDECRAIGIVASGSIHIQRIYETGKAITLETFCAGDSFGEALVFSDTRAYPATLVAREDSVVLFVPTAEILRLCEQKPAFMRELLRTLSNRILLLNRKIKSLTFGTVRQKVARYLIEEAKKQKVNRLLIATSRHELADSLGIPRPSLSRELIAMRDEGWIDFDRRTITIRDQQALEGTLQE